MYQVAIIRHRCRRCCSCCCCLCIIHVILPFIVHFVEKSFAHIVYTVNKIEEKGNCPWRTRTLLLGFIYFFLTSVNACDSLSNIQQATTIELYRITIRKKTELKIAIGKTSHWPDAYSVRPSVSLCRMSFQSEMAFFNFLRRDPFQNHTQTQHNNSNDYSVFAIHFSASIIATNTVNVCVQ